MIYWCGVTKSLLENVVSWKIKRGGPHPSGYPQPTLIHGHAPCLSGRRPSSAVHHFGGLESRSRAPLLRFRTSMAPSKGMMEELANIDQRLSALEAKFDSFSNEQKDGSNKRKKPARKNERECTYCKKAGKWFQGHEESECHHKKKDEAEAALQAIKERRERTGKRPKRLRVRRKPSRLVLLLIKDQPQLRRRLVVTSIQRVYLRPHPMLSPFQQ